MAQFLESNRRRFTAGAALAQYLRVVLSSSKLAAAGVTDTELGVLWEQAFADGDVRQVHLRNASGTVPMVAAAAITAGAVVYTAASGKISSTQATGALRIGVAMEAASGNNSVIEVLRD